MIRTRHVSARTAIVLLSALTLTSCIFTIRRIVGDLGVQKISVGRDERRYLLVVPASYKPGAKLPLVVVLHGGGGNGRGAEKMTGFTKKAEAEGFIVAYPYGWGRFDETLLTWNAGNCCGRALDQKKDDVDFIRQLIAFLKTQYSIDEGRVFATGMSNGGMMSYRLACELSDVVAAVGPVAGALNFENCQPAHPVGVVVVHGRADQHVLYDGGPPRTKVDSHPRIDNSVAKAVEFFKNRNGCGTPAVETKGRIETKSFPCESAGLRVYSIDGEGHTWPGGEKGYFGADSPARDFSATDVIWDFFKENGRHID